uniref:CYP728Q12 n=1 Tax=Taxus chinensis TaxID=29808 RepID=A0A291FAV5_TAXCH|nr:CYP728Q12 [Taxus chinensis]
MDSAMDATSLLVIVTCSTLLATVLSVLIAKTVNSGKGKNLPPGSLGLPVIGQTFEFLRAHKNNTINDWMEQKVAKYGFVFKTSLMGCPTVVVIGQEGNRFLFHNDCNTIANKQPTTVSRILGKKNILELNGEDHKRMRGAILQFLKPEALQKFVERMDFVIQQHFVDCWEGKECITVLPLTKTVTFRVACDMFFSLKDSKETDILGKDFTEALKGVWSLPLNLPGTAFHGGLKARSRICKRLSSLLQVRRGSLDEGNSSPDKDLMSCMLSMRDENGNGFTEEEIIDNVMAVMSAGHETTYTLLVHLVRLLALNPDVYHKVYEEQMKVLAGKQSHESLKWVDIQKMKYTWKVAQETLRLTSPIVGGFKKAIQNVEFASYTIPKGWQFFWSATSTHMNKEIFKEPKKFDPSRFESSVPPYSYTVFGGGPRICPGYDFTRMETLIYMHHLLCNYKWSLVDPHEIIVCDPVPLPVRGLTIKLQAIHS